MSAENSNGASVIGLGVAACAACCAVPILGVLAAAGIATAFAYLAVGSVALALIIPTVIWAVRRRHKASQCTTTEPAPPVPVTLGHRDERSSP